MTSPVLTLFLDRGEELIDADLGMQIASGRARRSNQRPNGGFLAGVRGVDRAGGATRPQSEADPVSYALSDPASMW